MTPQHIYNERKFALVKILGDYSFSHALLRVGDVEDVVDDLEGDANVAHALGELVHGLLANVHDCSHHLDEHAQQSSSFKRGHLDVFLC